MTLERVNRVELLAKNGEDLRERLKEPMIPPRGFLIYTFGPEGSGASAIYTADSIEYIWKGELFSLRGNVTQIQPEAKIIGEDTIHLNYKVVGETYILR